GNGKPYLAIGNSISLFGGVLFSNVSILLNDGLGGFSAGSGSPIPVNDSPISMATADFNNDGKADLVVASEASQGSIVAPSFTILLGDGTGRFTFASLPID